MGPIRVFYKITFRVSDNPTRSHGLRLGSSSGTGGTSDTRHHLPQRGFFPCAILLGNATNHLGNFFLTLLGYGSCAGVTLCGLVLRHLQLKLARGVIFLGLDFLQRQKVEQILSHLVTLL